MVHAPVVTDAKEIQTGRLKLKFWQVGLPALNAQPLPPAACTSSKLHSCTPAKIAQG
jgi:hypothetical protein